MSKRFYITTAIDYVNGAPHLGHAYEKIVTDVIARSRRFLGEQTFFLTGLDEHGQKVQQAAERDGKSTQLYCDELAAQWQAFAGRLDLINDDFIRTTDPRHKEVVCAVLNKLHAQGDLYKKGYKGFYSVKEETFLTEKDRNADGTWAAQWGEVVELLEENWYFKMGQHQQWLIDLIEANPSFVQPDYRRNEVLGFLRSETLEDLCITRPASRLSWGIPLPFDPEFVTYVWFDALTNYITVPAALGDPVVNDALKGHYHPASGIGNSASELWPADVHVIGKDIIKFHAVYWPIMLKAMGLPLPKQILAHGWWQKDGTKMSKSTGNVVDPIAVIDEWGVDAFRFYVVRELAIGPDGNWTDAGFQARYVAELQNGLGNLLNRTLNMLKKYRDSVVPAYSAEDADSAQAEAQIELSKMADVANDFSFTAQAIEFLKKNQLQDSLKAIFQLVSAANVYIEINKPYGKTGLAMFPEKAKRLDTVLYSLLETCRILSVLLTPFLPSSSAKILAQLGFEQTGSTVWDAKWGNLPAGHVVGEPLPLFPRKDQPKV
jgi:methionyl-tRNA synthetase